MLGILKKLKRIFTFGKDIAEAVQAWQAVAAEADDLARRYSDLPDDVQAFFKAVRRAFDETKDIVT